jgi:hypothetical protein
MPAIDVTATAMLVERAADQRLYAVEPVLARDVDAVRDLVGSVRARRRSEAADRARQPSMR